MRVLLGIVGLFLCFGGLAHVFLYFFAHESPLVTWPDAWGDLLGWTLRIGLIVAGGGLLLVRPRRDATGP